MRHQEEGEYESVAYHPGTGGQEEGHPDEGVLYQSLNEAGFAATTPTKACSSEAKDMPCAKYVGAWEFIEKFGHEAESLYHKGKRFVHKLLRVLGIHAPSNGAYVCAAVGVGVSFAITDSPFLEQAAIGALSGIGCAAVTN